MSKGNFQSRKARKYSGCPSKPKTLKAYYGGMDSRIFVNKDDPDYRPNYGKVYTERQLKIMNEELPLEEFTQGELTLLTRKAERLEDEEALEKLAYIQKLKDPKTEFTFSVSPSEAKEVLQSLTPWEIDWEKAK